MTESYLKEIGIISENSEVKLITPTIFFVQEIYILPILGTDLYNEVQTQIGASTEGTHDAVSVLNVDLLERFILPTMIPYTLHECTPVFKYRYMNKGIQVKNSENSTSADLSEIKFLMDKWKQTAEILAQRMTNFLKAHTTEYPLYCANTDCDDIKPNKTNYTSSLYLGNSDDREEYNIRIGNYE